MCAVLQLTVFYLFRGVLSNGVIDTVPEPVQPLIFLGRSGPEALMETKQIPRADYLRNQARQGWMWRTVRKDII
jgi:hypothetical protein